MPYSKTKAKSVKEYISLAPNEQKRRLSEIQKLIHQNTVGVTEKISYDMPVFLYKGKTLLYVAAQKRHIGLYALPDTNVHFENELREYKTGKGSIQFPNDKEIPLDLILKILSYRIKTIDTQET